MAAFRRQRVEPVVQNQQPRVSATGLPGGLSTLPFCVLLTFPLKQALSNPRALASSVSYFVTSPHVLLSSSLQI